MTIDEIYEKVNEFLVEDLEIEESKISEDARLKEVEEQFGFKMKPEDFKELITLDDFCKFIAARIG